MKNKNKFVLSASNYGKKIKIVLDEDSSLGDILEAFKSLAISLTFSETQWEKAINERATEGTIKGVKNK